MRTKDFLGKLAHDRIAQGIRAAEAKTSGEIRVYVQRGEVDDPVAAAREQFEKLGMTATRDRNGVLIFVAPRSQKFAIIGDTGIHQRCGDAFWSELTAKMRQDFQSENFTDAIVHAIAQTGAVLGEHFPRRPDDRNELPDRVEQG
jgi:uncharacterized membrane protein